MKNHIYTIQENQIDLLAQLAKFKSDDYYVILSNDRDWLDVAMWNNKYQNIAILSYTRDRLANKIEIIE